MKLRINLSPSINSEQKKKITDYSEAETDDLNLTAENELSDDNGVLTS